MKDDSFQSTYYLWRGHSGKAACRPSALLLVARESWVIIGISWSELGGWAQVFLTTPSPMRHPAMYTLTQTHASPCTQLKANTHPCMLFHATQRTWSPCKVPKSAACMLGWWERTSWKQWNGLICGFVSGFGKGPCSKPTFLWPLLKTSYLSLPIPSAHVLFVNIARVDYQRYCVSN